MNEEKAKEVEGKKTQEVQAQIGKVENAAKENAGYGAADSALPILEQAEITIRRLEEANKKTEELLKRQEELIARQLLGGRADAGQIPPKEKALSPIEYADLVSKRQINPFKV